MRFLYKRYNRHQLRSELSDVQDVIYSSIFLILDLIFWSGILSLMVYPLHQSITSALLIFIGFNLICLLMFYGLQKWMKEQPN
ncbi:hypothetical protein [Robertmurraya mangrovi]|uniref:hypothetical protein n=1 Tax=Robertmurraya mangrovi TaxID=3098077 RepID=UPI002ACBDDFB|nr:hypothetical protein [Bacillus sp. 31A1R]